MQENETLLGALGKLDQQCKELEAANAYLQHRLDGLPGLRNTAFLHQGAYVHLQQALDGVRMELVCEKQLRQQAEQELQVRGSEADPAD